MQLLMKWHPMSLLNYYKYLIFCSVFLCSCYKETNNIIVYTLRPVVVTNDNESLWNTDNLKIQFDNAKQIWSTAKIELDILEPEYIEDVDLYILNMSGLAYGESLTRDRAEKEYEYLVFFNRSIEKLIRNTTAMSALPSRLRAFTIISNDASSTALAHELGHALGLVHTWEEPFDKIHCTKYDCDTGDCKKNLMGYCFDNNMELTEFQKRKARFYALEYPRNLVTYELK